MASAADTETFCRLPPGSFLSPRPLSTATLASIVLERQMFLTALITPPVHNRRPSRPTPETDRSEPVNHGPAAEITTKIWSGCVFLRGRARAIVTHYRIW